EAPQNMRAINFLNLLVNNLNTSGGVLLRAGQELDPFSKWRRPTPATWLSLPEHLASGPRPGAILFHRANPLFSAPWLADAVKAAPFIASFSSFIDETAMVADLILPDNSNFESWDLATSISAATDPISEQSATAEPQSSSPITKGTDRGTSVPALITP